MPSGKARFNRPPTRIGENIEIIDCGPSIRLALQSFSPRHEAEQGAQAQYSKREFIERVIVAADWAVYAIRDARLSLTKQDLQAERDNVLITLETTRDKLRSLSPDFDRLLGIDADPLGCADSLHALILKVIDSNYKIAKHPNKLKAIESKHAISIELAMRVLPIAKEYGIIISASGSANYPGSESEAVKLLKVVGDAIDLKLEVLTWRNVIAKVKRQNLNL